MTIESPKFKKGYFEKKAENYNIIGKNLTPERKTEVVSYLEGRKDRSAEAIEGECIKTKEQLRFINYVGKCLKGEFKELGIDKKPDILPEQIHLLPRDIYRRETGRDSRPAFFFSLNQGVCINRDHYPTRIKLYKAIIHEMIHSNSFLRFQERKEELQPFRSKVGYSSAFGEKGERYEQFDGLNEMVADKFAFEVYSKHKEEFTEKFKFTDSEQNEGVSFYPTNILDTITKKIAVKNKENTKDVWERFKRGLFIGEVMHLRDVERTFGKDSLHLLSVFNFEDEAMEKNYGEILECFETDDDKKREEIIGELLPELEKHEIKPEEEGKISQER